MTEATTRLLRQVRERLAAAGIDSAAAEAYLLIEAATGLDRMALLTGSGPASAAQLERLEGLLKRRENREPLQLIVGHAHFHDLQLEVAPGVLIPRPETEVLVELALKRLKLLAAPAVIDVGPGSGAIALSIAKARPDATVLATDVSPAALELAGRNAARLGLDVAFRQADLLGGLGEAAGLDLLVSNPPYLPDSDRAELSPEVRQDPELALFAGEDGLGIFRRLLRQAGELLKPGAAVLLELDSRNVRQAAAEAQAGPWEQVRVLPDLTGRERFLEMVKSQS